MSFARIMSGSLSLSLNPTTSPQSFSLAFVVSQASLFFLQE